MSEAIKATQTMIEKQVKEGKVFMFGVPFSEYQRVYAGTNENINGYMSALNFDKKTNVLSVMASGDHIFNCAYYGITNIDTFDSNKLTEYFALGIKRSAIMAFNYQEYLLFLSKMLDQKITLEETTDLIKYLLPFMEEKHKIYWKSIMNYNYQLQKDLPNHISLFQMILMNINGTVKNTLNNSYLKDEESYNKLKTIINKINITFKKCDCLELDNNFNNQYDFIFLSNISDYFYKTLGNYWKYDSLKEINNNFNKLLKEDGTLALAYLYKFYNDRTKNYRNHPIECSKLQISDLITEQIITFPSIYNNKQINNTYDGIILQKNYRIL